MIAPTAQKGKRAAYTAYKPSGVEWLGDIPGHWEVRRLKTVARFGYGSSLMADNRAVTGAYPVYGSNGVVGEHDEVNTKAPCIIIGRKGSFGKVAYSDTPCFAIDTTYFIDLRFSSNDLRWLYYCLQCLRLDSFSKDSAVPGLSREDAYNNFLPFCPCAEQHAIATFLDRETARIDALIEKKRRQIDLLQEKRSALISHAVTKGLDAHAPMKHSGIEWLGEIPKHWKLKRLKFVAALQTGLTLGKKYDGAELVTRPYLRVANVQDGYLDLATITEIELPSKDTTRYELRNGDVLMTEGGDFDKLGRGYVWEDQIRGCLHQNHVFAVRPHSCELNSHFLASVLTSFHGKNYFTSTSQQTTNLATTNSTKLGNFPLPLPPLSDQEGILNHLRQVTDQLDMLREKISSSIEKLTEYRAALISAAVTGKIDVRKEVS